MPKVEVDLPLDEAMYISELAKERQTTFDLVLKDIIQSHMAANSVEQRESPKCPECGALLSMDVPGGGQVVSLCSNPDCGYVLEARSYDS
ncbi:hypothetical protein [Marinobacter halotolerans]|uniref:hypothetical protein n=1 Tax=Marinobacter halotolerans TaxID=1569211 RepID=UPI00124493E8|nr:hypothetical protein [Marinobacter halotolerans]